VLDRLLTVTDTLGNIVSSSYDACGRLLSQSDGLGTLMTYTYDNAGRLIRTNTPTTSYYDGSSVSQVTQYSYDADGRLTQVTDPAGKTSGYRYDALGRTLTATDPAGRTATCTYDALNLTATTDPKGQTFNYTYDGLNRLTQLSAPGQTISYSYLANGLVHTMTDAGGSTTYSYDNDNRLTQAQTPQGTIRYGYNLAGLTTSATYPQGTVRYEYDNQGRLSTIKRPDASYAGLAFDSGDRITQLSQYRSDNGLFLRTTYSYNALSRITKIQNTTGPTLSLAYSYDARANVTAKTATTVGGTTTSTYGYDLLGHITSTSSNGSLTRYAFDAMGNRSKINTASGTSTYTYDSQTVRRLLSVTTPSGNFSFSYDANGNTSGKVTSTGTWTYSYDPFNRLTGVQWNGVSQATYGYNGRGQRTSKTAGGVSSSYLWDGANLAQENRGGTYYLYSYLGMQPIALTSTGSSQALETDLVGTVLGVVNTSGTEIARYVSDDFGNPQSVVGSSPNPFRFAGAFLDGETGLVQMRGRYYDPAFGRFLTPDVNPGNPYSYCRNNPTSMSDPSGWGSNPFPWLAVQEGYEWSYQLAFKNLLLEPDKGLNIEDIFKALNSSSGAWLKAYNLIFSGDVGNLERVAQTAEFFIGMTAVIIWGEEAAKGKVCIDFVAMVLRIALQDSKFEVNSDHTLSSYWFSSRNIYLWGGGRGQLVDFKVVIYDVFTGVYKLQDYLHTVINLGVGRWIHMPIQGGYVIITSSGGIPSQCR